MTVSKYVNPYTDVNQHAKLTSEQYDAYLKSILEYNEAKAVLDTARSDGKREEKIEIAKTMLAEGFDVATIARITKLTTAEVEALK